MLGNFIKNFCSSQKNSQLLKWSRQKPFTPAAGALLPQQSHHFSLPLTLKGGEVRRKRRRVHRGQREKRRYSGRGHKGKSEKRNGKKVTRKD